VRKVLETLVERKDLTAGETKATLTAMLNDFDTAQVAAFLALLRAKGETADEVFGLADAMRDRAVKVDCSPHSVVDIVGTGGDGIGSVNISTGACIIAAAAGARVAKHGSRSSSSLCGAADVLEALGIPIDLGPDAVARCVADAGIGFMFAPVYHPAMKAVREVRSSLKIRTAFNILGPMLNPAGAKYGLVGVYSTSISELMGDALQKMGMEKALVVHSAGLDELTPMAPAHIYEVTSQTRRTYTLDPQEMGIKRCEVEDLKGGDAQLNATILRDVFGGAKGPVADALNLNAGVALAACKVAKDVKEGIRMAQEAQEQGKAGATLKKWVDVAAACKATVAM